MKGIYPFVISISLFLSWQSLQAQDTTRVLFLGNSLTYVNDLPLVFKTLAVAGGHEVVTDASVFGGYTLQMHFNNAQSLQKIQQGGWDYVVLQEQSQIPSMAAYLPTEFYPYGVKLDSVIHLYNPAAKTVMFLTFAHKNGDEGILGAGGFDTYWLMQGRLREGYLHLADSIGAMVAPVGCAWREVRLADPTIELYGDPVHPSPAGTYLAANVFYATLFQQNTVGNPYLSGLDPVVAQFLQQKASELVMDSLVVWNIEQSTGMNSANPKGKAEVKIWYDQSQGQIRFYWEMTQTGEYNFCCYNLIGQKVLENVVPNNQGGENTIINTPRLKPGLYFVTVSTENEKVSGRFLVQ
jgi:hypothetical protein